ncbi:hypothetical protein EOE67_02145 [Rheinheimera riviphila]|uniref:Outer membrane protein beta-barrel domain-containing protein n=1 Tax=Rheinheimera riviphila TaxID=1834037 RepID=A0A437R5E6_9GAMM|nr:outer membrane beta-barrel protein [Rheinheimera riviphila]RVU42008.1 hypothetical protein EOE67_02145 [Rheinheimera riviphila]
MQFFRKTMFGVLGLCSLPALANDHNQFDYFGLNIQKSSYQNIQFLPQINPVALAPLTYKETLSGTGFRGFIGHQFNHYVALEAGVNFYGKADFRVTQETTGADGKPSYKTVQSGGFETSAGDLRVVGTYPISDSFYLKANLGALLWNNELTTLAGSVATPEPKKTSDNGVSAIAGLGVGYGLNSKVAITLDVEKTKIAGIHTQNIGLSLLIRI